MNPTMWRLALVLNFVLVPALVSPGCVRTGEERAELDERVGKADAEGVRFEVAEGLAAVHQAARGRLVLWAGAPSFELETQSQPGATTDWEITVQNVMPDAELVPVDEDDVNFKVTGRKQSDPTTVVFGVELPAGETARMRIAPPDADEAEPYRVAVLSDIQNAVLEVGDIWAKINEDPSIRYVISTGDITQSGRMEELVFFQESLGDLDVPYYTTLGNHELGEASPEGFHELYGRGNFQFQFKDVYFTYLDSASATIDPIAYDWLEEWLERGEDATHIFLTHIPPIDPVGTRNGSFRSRNEAMKLLSMLTKADVDLGLYGHIHTYMADSQAEIPIYISGGGGALPEKFDGIGRHFLTVDIDPDEGIKEVGLVRVGEPPADLTE